MYAAMEKLTKRQREVVRMKFMEGMSHREISEELGITESSVYKIKMQGIKKLKKVIAKQSKQLLQ